MKTFSGLRLLAVLLLLTLGAEGMPWKKVFIKNYSVENGLPQNSVNDILQDRQGYIWVSTTGGIRRLDGNRFYEFSGTTGQLINNMQSAMLHLDNTGHVWIITANIVARYDDQTGDFTVVHRAGGGDPSGYVYVLGENARGDIIYYHKNDGLLSLSPVSRDIKQLGKRNFRFVKPPYTYIPINQPDTTKFMYAVQDTVYTIDLTDFTEQAYTGLVNRCNSPIFGKYLNNCVRLAARDQFKTGAEKSPLLQHSCPSLVITDSSATFYKNLADTLGIEWRDQRGHAFSPGINAYKILADRSGNYWIATLNDGLWRVNVKENPFTILSNAATNTFTRSIYFNAHGNNVIVTYYQGGFAVLDPSGNILETHRSYKNYHLLADRNVLCGMQTDSANYLFITQDAPYAFSGNRLTKEIRPLALFRDLPPESFRFYSSVAEGAPYTYYINNRYSVYRIKSNAGKAEAACIYTGKNLIGGLVASEGLLYLGLDGGSYEILDTSGALKQQVRLSGDPETMVKDIHNAPGHGLFVATTKGLYRMRGNTAERIDGLPNNYIYNIEHDQFNTLWLSTNRGLAGWNMTTGQVIHFTSADGFCGNECNTNCMELLPNGTMMAGTRSGIAMFQPGALQLIPTPPPPVITAINLVDRKGKSSVYPVNTAQIRTSYDRSTISILCADMSYIAEDQAALRYRIAGTDTTWQTAGTAKELRLMLQPGTWKVEIQTGNIKTGRFSTSSVLGIFVAPPFWQNWWFYLLEIMVLTGVVFLVVHMLHRRKMTAMLRQFQLQQAVQLERERISRELHDNLGAQATTLTAGLRDLEQLVAPGTASEAVSNVMETGKNIMQNLRESIWALNNEEITLVNLCDRYKGFAKTTLRSWPGIRLKVTERIAYDMRLKPAVALNILRILQEALHNTIKHANATEVCLTCSSSTDSGLEIIYADNGTGFPDNTTAAEEGYGLANMRLRAAEAGVVIAIGNGANGGMSLTLILNKNG